MNEKKIYGNIANGLKQCLESIIYFSLQIENIVICFIMLNTIKLHGKSYQGKLLKVIHTTTFLQKVKWQHIANFRKLLHETASTLLAFKIHQSLKINTWPRIG